MAPIAPGWPSAPAGPWRQVGEVTALDCEQTPPGWVGPVGPVGGGVGAVNFSSAEDPLLPPHPARAQRTRTEKIVRMLGLLLWVLAYTLLMPQKPYILLV